MSRIFILLLWLNSVVLFAVGYELKLSRFTLILAGIALVLTTWAALEVEVEAARRFDDIDDLARR